MGDATAAPEQAGTGRPLLWRLACWRNGRESLDVPPDPLRARMGPLILTGPYSGPPSERLDGGPTLIGATWSDNSRFVAFQQPILQRGMQRQRTLSDHHPQLIGPRPSPAAASEPSRPRGRDAPTEGRSVGRAAKDRGPTYHDSPTAAERLALCERIGKVAVDVDVTETNTIAPSGESHSGLHPPPVCRVAMQLGRVNSKRRYADAPTLHHRSCVAFHCASAAATTLNRQTGGGCLRRESCPKRPVNSTPRCDRQRDRIRPE